ncbi:MAG: methylated-DNA--[protein]-cysteine S-methyltransferase [Candidatus Binatia bacterium]
MRYTVTPSPLGPILVAGDAEGLRRISFQSASGAFRPDRGWVRSDRAFREAIEQLRAYFAGTLRRFDLPLSPVGTPFQRDVWRALAAVPYGETRSYGDLARAIGKPAAARAVGAASGRNPLPIVIPCHRLVGSGGELTGYYGGLHLKRALLELERR